MPICPHCKTEQAKRKRDACPECGGLVEVYNGHWFRAEIGAPSTTILKDFERRVSIVLSHGRPVSIVYQIPRKGIRYKRELVAAERLLVDAVYDFDLVQEALTILFSDPQFNWKTRNSLLYIEPDFLLALAIAKGNRAAEELKKQQSSHIVLDVLSREDIFS